MARSTSPDPHRHASPRTMSRIFPSLACQIACCGVNPLSCQCEACFSLVLWYVILTGDEASRGLSVTAELFAVC